MIESMVGWACIGSGLVLMHLCGVAFFKDKYRLFHGEEGWIILALLYCVAALILFYAVLFTIHFWGHRNLFTSFVYPLVLFGLSAFGPVFILRQASAQFFFFSALTAFVLAIFFSFAFNGDAIQLAEGRFLTGWLASDNTLPWIFAKGIYGLEGTNLPMPLFADWMPGDRPPAYTAILMVPLAMFGGQNPAGPYFEYLVPVYTASSIVLNTFYVLPAYLLLREKFNSIDSGCLVTALVFLPVLLVNHAFAWPKHFAMFGILAAVYLLRKRRIFWACVACAIAFLSHGNSIYILLPLGVIFLIRHRQQCLSGIAAALALWTPWVLAQKLIFPPGDRLIKYHLAGVQDVTNTDAFKTVLTAYGDLSFNEWISYKLNNLYSVGGLPLGAFQKGDSSKSIGWLQFFFPIPSMLPMLVAVVSALLLTAFVKHQRKLSIIFSSKYNEESGKFSSNSKIDAMLLLFFSIITGIFVQFGGTASSLLTNVTLNSSIVVLAFILICQFLSNRFEVIVMCTSMLSLSVASLHLNGAPDKAFVFAVSSLGFYFFAFFLAAIGCLKHTRRRLAKI